MHRHLTDEELIERLYGLGETPPPASCETCRRRWEGLLERRRRYLGSVAELPEAWLADQRRRIYARIERAETGFWGVRPAGVLAALGVVAFGLVLSLPAPEPQPTRAANDSQFFTEIYSLVESPEPRAAAPIHSLFEEPQ
jgi:hypothetical protein